MNPVLAQLQRQLKAIAAVCGVVRFLFVELGKAVCDEMIKDAAVINADPIERVAAAHTVAHKGGIMDRLLLVGVQGFHRFGDCVPSRCIEFFSCHT